jgi:imidazolonepropionase
MGNTKKVLLVNISELVTLKPLVDSKRYHSIKEGDLGIIEKAWLYVEDKKIVSFGKMPVPMSLLEKDITVHDACNSLVMPGFVDCHTHPLYAGSRDKEFSKRLIGYTYKDIANMGGGIQTTVKATCAASDAQLIDSCVDRLGGFLEYGVTSLEAKTGYGDKVEEEIRHLRLFKEVEKKVAQKVIVTCLPLHTPPRNKLSSAYIDEVISDLLPEVAYKKLASYVDMFLEKNYFSYDDCDRLAKKANELNLPIRVHADEFSNSGGARLAAKWRAASADHLQYATAGDCELLAKSQTTAVLLPGTSLFTNIAYTKAKLMREAGCSIAIASDHNPGSSPFSNISMLASLACIYCGLSSPELIAGLTLVPAKSLNLQSYKGALVSGYDADYTIWPYGEFTQWVAAFGQRRPSSVWIAGERVISV